MVRIQAIRLAGILGKEESAVVPALVSQFESGNVEVRLAAVQELGHLGAAARKALPDLAKLARSDSRASVRDAAEVARKKIEQGP